MIAETRNKKQETRNKKQETRNKKQETRNKKQETRNKKQETRNKKFYHDIAILDYGNLYVINPDPLDDSVCITIKAQYYKNSLANIFHRGTFGCTGVIVEHK